MEVAEAKNSARVIKGLVMYMKNQNDDENYKGILTIKLLG